MYKVVGSIIHMLDLRVWENCQESIAALPGNIVPSTEARRVCLGGTECEECPREWEKAKRDSTSRVRERRADDRRSVYSMCVYVCVRVQGANEILDSLHELLTKYVRYLRKRLYMYRNEHSCAGIFQRFAWT